MSEYNSRKSDRVVDRREFLKSAALATAGATTFCASASFLTSETFADGPASAASEVKSCPYGVCAHIGGGEEWSQAPKNLKLMKAAGIRWIRADFSWSGVERKRGEWTFDHLDKIVGETTSLGLQILPILDYSVEWATPSYKHMDAWLEYVKRTVARYADRIRYWEVWNEENLKGFWADEPSAENYATLLKETYKAIKEIDSELIVVYGGLAGVPADYFAKSLDAGAGNYFDVVNIHPYRGGLTTRERIDRFRGDIDAFRKALAERSLPEKPIWITEMGWATPPVFGETNRRVVAAAIQRLYPGETPRIAFYYDDRYDGSASRSRDDFFGYLPPRYADRRELVSYVDSEGLKKLSAQSVDMLVMPPGETFPEDCFDAMVAFVKSGGSLVLQGGVPFYYASRIDEKTGRYRRESDNPNFGRNLESLRISWFAWWTRENVPETAPAIVASEALDFAPKGEENALKGFNIVYKAGRFFSDAALKEGDEMIPLINGKTEDFLAPTACIYKFNSDYKGAVVVNAIMDLDGVDTNVSTVENQGVFLPQAYLLAFAFGIERYFWYEFHAPERDDRDPEHHFGMVGQKLDPKPAYHALKAMTNARPAGSKNDKLELNGEDCVMSWTRPDGKIGWAIWTARTSKNVEFEISGATDEAFDYLGSKVEAPVSGVKREIAPKILYLVGPKRVALR